MNNDAKRNARGAMIMSENELAIIEERYPVLNPAADMTLIKEAVGPDGFQFSDLERIKLPSGGGISWELPTLDGEPEVVKSFDAIIMHQSVQRVYYEKSIEESEGSSAPDCISRDCIHGEGTPGGLCKACPLSQWGTGRNGGQACQQKNMLFLLRPGSLLPSVLIAPATSLKVVRQYVLGLAARGLLAYGVVTTFSLEKDKNSAGTVYAKMVLKKSGDLTAENIKTIEGLRNSLMPTFSTATAHEDPVDVFAEAGE
jgi:hypothetical protein